MNVFRRGIPFLLGVLLTTALAAPAAAECDGSFVTVEGKQISVQPTGGEDTANLQCAIDLGVTLGAGASVRLGPGVFSTAQLLIKDFRGSIRGAGQGVTVLRTPGYALPIARPCEDERGCFADTPPAADNPYPVLIAVLGRDVTISDVSFVTNDGLGTERYLGWLNVMSGVIEVLDSGAFLRVDRVSVENAGYECGDDGCHGDAIQGVAMWRWFWWPGRLTGSSLVVDDSTFATPTPIIAGQVDNGRVVVTRSRFSSPQALTNGPLSVFDLQKSQMRFEGNEVNMPTTAVAVALWGWVTTPDANAVMRNVTVQIANNTFAAQIAVGLDPGTLGASSTCVIANNDVSAVTGTPYTLSDNPCRVVADR